MIKRRSHRSFNSYIDLSREYYAAQGYTKPYVWSYHQDAPFTKLEKPLSQCRIALVTTADIEKLPGKPPQNSVKTLLKQYSQRSVSAEKKNRETNNVSYRYYENFRN